MKTRIRVYAKPVSDVLIRLGVDKNGDVQMQTTRIVNKRITRYMPYRTSALSTKLKYIKSPTEIEVNAPYARYQYYGKVMVDSATGRGPFYIEDVGFRYRKGAVLKVTDRDLRHDKSKHWLAGPFWDKRMMAAEGKMIAQDIQAYVNRRKK